jgi:hypothetical protein
MRGDTTGDDLSLLLAATGAEDRIRLGEGQTL